VVFVLVGGGPFTFQQLFPQGGWLVVAPKKKLFIPEIRLGASKGRLAGGGGDGVKFCRIGNHKLPPWAEEGGPTGRRLEPMRAKPKNHLLEFIPSPLAVRGLGSECPNRGNQVFLHLGRGRPICGPFRRPPAFLFGGRNRHWLLGVRVCWLDQKNEDLKDGMAVSAGRPGGPKGLSLQRGEAARHRGVLMLSGPE